jgi:plastocyanin
VESAGPSPRSLVLLPQTVNVTVQDNFFSPQVIHVAVGDTVRWTWAGTPHTVTAGECSTGIYEDCVVSNAFCSPNDLNCINNPTSGVGFVYSHQFNTAGTFRYFCREHLASMTGIVIVDAAASPTVQLSAATYNVNESSGVANLTITRTGTTTNGATVDYKTSDTAGLNNCSLVNGIASARCDYPTAVGTVRFAAGETVKNISIPIVDDGYAEGSENFTVTLSKPTGDSLGTPSSATVTINDNEASDGPNPIVGTQFFVRQQYLDFLGREPDPNGYASWQQIINNCPAGDTTCDRIHVSSAFFRSPEFQDRGYFVYRFYPVAFGRKPDYAEFVPDLAKVSGFLSDAELEAAKVAFINEFMSRPAFVTKFNGLTDTQYVDTLLSTAGVAQHQFRDFWIAALGNGTRTRATVLRDISETPEVYNKYFNQAFVVMQYFGYLRRDPDGLYVDWIAVLDANSSDFRGMVNGFMNSLEYRFRFGQ